MKYGTSVFNSIQSPQGVNPLLFSELCVYHYTDVCKTSGIRVGYKIKEDESNQSTDWSKKAQIFLAIKIGF